jgi:hypothetical protein
VAHVVDEAAPRIPYHQVEAHHLRARGAGAAGGAATVKVLPPWPLVHRSSRAIERGGAAPQQGAWS